MLQEVEDLDRQLRLMSDSHSALAAADGMRQLTIIDKGRSSHKVSAHSIAKKVGLTLNKSPQWAVYLSLLGGALLKFKSLTPVGVTLTVGLSHHLLGYFL